MGIAWYLLTYFIIYLLTVFAWLSYRIYKQTGSNAIVFGNTDSAHDYIGRIMKVLMVLLFAVLVIYLMSDTVYHFLIPIPYLMNDIVVTTGLILIHVSLIWIATAQYQMKESWRMGIDQNTPTALVTTGFFSFSRNPIFLGIIISVSGIFMVLPNALTFFVLLTTYLIIQIQIRMEEAFLEQQHGEQYILYKQQTKRLL